MRLILQNTEFLSLIGRWFLFSPIHALLPLPTWQICNKCMKQKSFFSALFISHFYSLLKCKYLNILIFSSWRISIIIFRTSVPHLLKYFSVLFTIHFSLFAERTKLPLPGKANVHSSKVINWSDAFENLNITVFVTVNNPVWGSELIAMPVPLDCTCLNKQLASHFSQRYKEI